MNESKESSGKNGQRDLTWVVVLFFAVVWILFVHSRAYSTNESSRLASIESLVHRGTWVIDESPFSHTLDKIQVGEQFYSSKPPTLSFLGAGIYRVLHDGLDQTLVWRECIPDRTPSHCRAILEPEETNWYTQTMLNVQGLLIDWDSLSGRTYKVYCMSNLLGQLPTNPVFQVPGDGTRKSYTGIVDTTRRKFYRLKVEEGG